MAGQIVFLTKQTISSVLQLLPQEDGVVVSVGAEPSVDALAYFAAHAPKYLADRQPDSESYSYAEDYEEDDAEGSEKENPAIPLVEAMVRFCKRRAILVHPFTLQSEECGENWKPAKSPRK